MSNDAGSDQALAKFLQYFKGLHPRSAKTNRGLYQSIDDRKWLEGVLSKIVDGSVIAAPAGSFVTGPQYLAPFEVASSTARFWSSWNRPGSRISCANACHASRLACAPARGHGATKSRTTDRGCAHTEGTRAIPFGSPGIPQSTAWIAEMHPHHSRPVGRGPITRNSSRTFALSPQRPASLRG